jgi:hypothetical protein
VLIYIDLKRFRIVQAKWLKSEEKIIYIIITGCYNKQAIPIKNPDGSKSMN